MAGLVPAIHVVGLRHALGVRLVCRPGDVDGRDKPGHDGFLRVGATKRILPYPSSKHRICRPGAICRSGCGASQPARA